MNKSSERRLRDADLAPLWKRCNERQEVIEHMRRQIDDIARAAIVEIILQGQALNEARSLMSSELFQQVLKAHCPTISPWRARHYATTAQRPENTTNALEALLFALKDERTKPTRPPKHWPPPIDATSRAARLQEFLAKHPIEQWPADNIEAFREVLLPLVAKLWPDKVNHA